MLHNIICFQFQLYYISLRTAGWRSVTKKKKSDTVRLLIGAPLVTLLKTQSTLCQKYLNHCCVASAHTVFCC